MARLLVSNPTGNTRSHSRISLAFLVLALGGLPRPAGWAAENASLPAAQAGEVLVRGKVAGAYDNAEFLMEDTGKYYTVSIGKDLWKLGIRRGDEVAVAGTLKKFTPFQNEIKARTAQVINRPLEKVEPLRVRRASDVREYGKGGELAVLRGRITGYHNLRMELTDTSGRVLVDLDSPELREKFNSGMEVVVIGLLTGPKDIRYKEVSPVLIRPTTYFLREGEPATADTIKNILKSRPVGKLVKAHGWARKFIGKEQAIVLADGEERLIIRPSEKYLSLDPKVGGEVEVVGVFGYETHEGKEFGTLNEARIDPMVVVSNRKP